MTAEEKRALNREVAELLGWSIWEQDRGPQFPPIQYAYGPSEKLPADSTMQGAPIETIKWRQLAWADYDPNQFQVQRFPQFTDDWRAAGMLLEMMPDGFLLEHTGGWWISSTHEKCFGTDTDLKQQITGAFRDWKSSKPKGNTMTEPQRLTPTYEELARKYAGAEALRDYHERLHNSSYCGNGCAVTVLLTEYDHAIGSS